MVFDELIRNEEEIVLQNFGIENPVRKKIKHFDIIEKKIFCIRNNISGYDEDRVFSKEKAEILLKRLNDTWGEYI